MRGFCIARMHLYDSLVIVAWTFGDQEDSKKTEKGEKEQTEEGTRCQESKGWTSIQEGNLHYYAQIIFHLKVWFISLMCHLF